VTQVSTKEIVEIAADRFGVPVEAVYGNRKLANHVDARHVAWFVMRRITDMSYPNIALRFKPAPGRSDKHHTTIMHGVRRVANRDDLLAAARECTLAVCERATKDEVHG